MNSFVRADKIVDSGGTGLFHYPGEMLTIMADSLQADADHGDLLIRCAAEDRSALKMLYEREAPRMKGVARRILKRDDLAEEAMQDAFVRIWNKAGQYDPARGSALGWIYTVQRSVALNALRRDKNEDLTAPEDLDAVQERQAEFETVDAIWERLDQSGRLKICLSGLDPAKRKVVLLAYAYGLSHGEIAGRLARPLGTVKAWVLRGLNALRECMQ